MAKKQIITIQRSTPDIDIKSEFSNYKYAVHEMQPVKLSNGLYLHVIRVTKYSTDDYMYGDPDVEQETFNNELYN